MILGAWCADLMYPILQTTPAVAESDARRASYAIQPERGSTAISAGYVAAAPQDIFRARLQQCLASAELSGELDEATVLRIAWGAVKRQYHKPGGEWVRRDASRDALAGRYWRAPVSRRGIERVLEKPPSKSDLLSFVSAHR